MKFLGQHILVNYVFSYNTQEDIDKADTFPLVFQRFLDWIGKESYVICSWGHYDKRQFIRDCHLHGINTDWIENKHISLKHQHAEKILGQPNKPVGMAKALRIAKLPLEGIHHRGIDDAMLIPFPSVNQHCKCWLHSEAISLMCPRCFVS